MADAIKLPPLPEPPAWMNDEGDVFARQETPEMELSLPTMLYTTNQLRARDIEVARLVLEAAAKECEKRERVIGELHADQKPGTEAFWMVQGVMSASRRNAEHIRAMEVRHHE